MLIRSPCPGVVFVSQGSEGGNDIREVGDELLIEVTESKEGADDFDSFGWKIGRAHV